MTEQLDLATAEPVLAALFEKPAKPLTDNQQRAFDYIRAHAGVTAEQIGAHLHSTRDERPHPVTDPCQWCEKSGRQTAESKGLKPFVTYSNVDGVRVYRPRRREDALRRPEPVREPTEAELAANPFTGL
jgi:hypothetical protein